MNNVPYIHFDLMMHTTHYNYMCTYTYEMLKQWAKKTNDGDKLRHIHNPFSLNYVFDDVIV